MAEKILNDLKSSGQESIEALVTTIASYQGVEDRMNKLHDREQEILDRKVQDLDTTQKHLAELHNFCKTEIGQQDSKIANLMTAIDGKKEDIWELRRVIVRYEQKCEIQLTQLS